MAAADRTPGIRPLPTLGRRLDQIWRHAFPTVTSVFLMMLTTAHWGFRGQSALLPTVSLTCVWFWSLYRPGAMAPPVVFLIGLLLDLLGYLPPGVGPLTMLTAHGLARRMRSFLAHHGLLAVWSLFTAIACGIAGMNWGLVSLLTLTPRPLGPVLFEAGLAVAMYPLVAVPLMLAHRTIADPDLA